MCYIICLDGSVVHLNTRIIDRYRYHARSQLLPGNISRSRSKIFWIFNMGHIHPVFADPDLLLFQKCFQ